METTPSIIIDIVCNYFRVPKAKVLSTCRKREYVKARQVSIYFIRRLFNHSSEAIGQLFPGKIKFKDHATILHSVRRVENDMLTDKNYKQDIENIKGIINPESVIISHKEIKDMVALEVLSSENKHLRDENIELKNEISKLHGTIYGLKITRKKEKKVKEYPLITLNRMDKAEKSCVRVGSFHAYSTIGLNL